MASLSAWLQKQVEMFLPEEELRVARNFPYKTFYIIMLKKENRLTKAKDIQNAFAKGRSFFNYFYTIKYSFSPTIKKFTVVVSTKVFKSAVKRNRVKRIIREYIRKNLIRFKTGNYLVVVKPKLNTLPETEILKNFLDVCARLR